MNHTKIHVNFLQFTKIILSLSDEMHVNYWTGCEQKITNKGILLSINNMTFVISLMFLAHVSLPQAPDPTTSVISFDPPATLLFHLPPVFSQDIPRDRVSHSASFGIHKHLCLYVLVPSSHRSHPWCSTLLGHRACGLPSRVHAPQHPCSIEQPWNSSRIPSWCWL